jgi:hypothetical protein
VPYTLQYGQCHELKTAKKSENGASKNNYGEHFPSPLIGNVNSAITTFHFVLSRKNK